MSSRPNIGAVGIGGEAVVRTVAHGFEPWEPESAQILEPASAGERKLSLARQGGLTNRECENPHLKMGATVLMPASPPMQFSRARPYVARVNSCRWLTW